METVSTAANFSNILPKNTPNSEKGRGDDDSNTECETPVSSPERDIAAFAMKKSSDHEEKIQHHDASPTVNDVSNASISTTNTYDSSPISKTENKYFEWPMENIREPGRNDVLYGRGGGTNHHDGNKRYRKMVERRKVAYVNAKRLDKPLVALEIINQWRNQSPPGRFLKLDYTTSMWNDVGDKKAREKTSQALREKAPLLRKQQEELLKEKTDFFSSNTKISDERKNTRFQLPSPQSSPSIVNQSVRRATLSRDHSLGHDFADVNEPISIKDFSWDSNENLTGNHKLEQSFPLAKHPSSSSWISTNRHSSQNLKKNRPNYGQDLHQADDYNFDYGKHPPSIQNNSIPNTTHINGRSHILSPERHHPVVPSPIRRRSEVNPLLSSRRNHDFNTSINSECRYSHDPTNSKLNYPHSDDGLQAKWTKQQYSDIDTSFRQSRSAENDYRSKQNHWRTNTIAHTRSQGTSKYEYRDRIVPHEMTTSENAYAQRWEGYNNGHRFQESAPCAASSSCRTIMIPSTSYNSNRELEWATPLRTTSIAVPCQLIMGDFPSIENPIHKEKSIHTKIYPNLANPSTTNRDAMAMGHDDNPPMYNKEIDTPTRAELPSLSPSRSIPRPHPIKRDTSHHCENIETKSSVKRMNRQKSIGHHSIQNSMSSLVEVTETDMNDLQTHLRQSSIGEIGLSGSALFTNGFQSQSHCSHPLEKPNKINQNDRIPTIDCFDVNIEGSSAALDEDELKLDEPQLYRTIDHPESMSTGVGYRTCSVGSIKIEDIAGIIDGPNNRPRPMDEEDRTDTIGTLDTADICEI